MNNNWSVNHNPAYWGNKKLCYPNVPKEHAKFSESVTVENIIFVSGCIGKDVQNNRDVPKNIEDQVYLALDNTRLALERAGSSMENILKTFSLIRDLSTYGQYRKAETEYYEKYAPTLIRKPPSATLMVYPGLALQELKIEYEVVAAVNRETQDWNVVYYPEFWGGKELAFPHVPKEHPKFARSQLIGQLVLVSGCQALDHNTERVETMDFKEQAILCLEKIKIAMEETGGSWATVAKTNVFIKNSKNLKLYREIENNYFREKAPSLLDAPPASTTFIVKELPREEFLVEIEAFGVSGKGKNNWSVKKIPGEIHRASSVKVENLVYFSACNSVGTLEEQINGAFDKLHQAAKKTGTSLDKIIKTNMMLTDTKNYNTMRKLETEYYQKNAPYLLENPPACTYMEVNAIEGDKALFQIDAIGVFDATK